MSLFIPTYFAPISQYSEIIKAATVTFEMEDNFQKQSYRNRCYIYNSSGKQLLSIPVKHQLKDARKKTKDTLVENNFRWQDQHFKSLQIAYRTSPFFDLLEADIAPIFEKKYKYLQDINIDTFLFITDALQLNSDFSATENYKVETTKNDYRFLSDRKHKPTKPIENYIQMFDDKHGFIPNLSILDLLFMEGPNTISYL
ncbi:MULTISPECIES: WbqC family protein [unclassified Polaribacter]|uniref:WbqC family protein n=1 Tax=unclassified Polaribacter TaxID=196858 RepID=UPI0011BFC615|nr:MULTISPECIES: WbqC family protein [unclassified Polaribacter]TXD52043.1 WbqC family protein [Polaribacter sp. IC063]TXD59765.1 WbqC family protein [Polaribacter sp. IC066]